MTLEDFENSLAEQKRIDANTAVGQREKEFKKHRRRHRHHDDHRHDLEKDQPRHKRRRRSSSRNSNIRSHDSRNRNPSHTGELTKDTLPQSEEDETGKRDPAILSPASYIDDLPTSSANDRSKRDAWMEGPSALDIDYTQNKTKKPSHPTTSRSSKIDFELKIHENELNKHHLQNLADGKDIPHEVTDESSQHEVDYLFGDAGAQWRMTKLNSVYRRAKETGRLVDDVAQEQFGDLRSFDDAREEQIELERRDTYGEDYVGKQKPSGDLFGERKVDLGIRKDHSHYESRNDGIISEDGPREIAVKPQVGMNVQMDQTTLNRLKAQALKARLRGSSNAVNLEAEFKNATATFVDCEQPDVVILGAMENRTLSGSREGEVKNIDNKRGRERGLVEANDEMSIEDMVREERRTRGQAGGDGRRFAERIAKDGNFNVSNQFCAPDHCADICPQDNLDYLDENASKLARRVQKSEVNFKNTAISDFQKMNRILDNCPLCHHEDTDTPPVAPIVSLATRVYLTLPTEPEISEGGACIVPVQHRNNLLECDDDEWEEMRVCIQQELLSLGYILIDLEFYEKYHPHVS